jgi:hypothetical protein
VLVSVLSHSGVNGNTCNSSSPNQVWAWATINGALTSANGLCLTASSWPPADGTALVMTECTSSAAQAFDVTPANNFIVSRYDPAKCVNLASYGTTPGSQVWLYGCVPPNYTCEGNCDWEPAPEGHLRNSESGLCLDDGYAPPMTHTCANGSVAAGLPFCNTSLSFEERASDIVSRLTTEFKQVRAAVSPMYDCAVSLRCVSESGSAASSPPTQLLYVLPLPVSVSGLINRR